MGARVMSRDALTGESLLAAAESAQAALDAGTPSAGSSEARFIAAMIARTRELAKRDQAMVPAIAAQELVVVSRFGKESDLNAVTAAIRNGAFDGDSSLHQAIYRLAVLRLRATKPEALAPEDRI
ncbi:MAG TPA: hypothetical protein VMT98_01050 [Verrucomicrobiae bacterium]|jgi:hypothetical protein|nr:hypothetical protein [Verrucomicrobiae bacterium]